MQICAFYGAHLWEESKALGGNSIIFFTFIYLCLFNSFCSKIIYAFSAHLNRIFYFKLLSSFDTEFHLI